MPSIRSMITFAIPAVTAFFGFLWIISKKKPPERKKVTSSKKDDTKTSARNESNHTTQTSRDENTSAAADAVNMVSQIEELFIDGSGDAAHLPRDTESLLDRPVAAETVAKKEGYSETSTKPGNATADLASDLPPEISEQLIESTSIVAESAQVTESMIQSENASKTSVKPPEKSTTDLHQNNDSSSMTNIEDSLISQIICSNTNTDTDNKIVESDDQKQVTTTAEVGEKMTSEVNNSVNISPEINSQNTIASNHASLSQDSNKVTSEPQQSSSETRLQNNLLELEKEKTSETSQMSRSWHEELEESEKTALNGPSKLEGEDVKSSKSDKKIEKVSNNTKEEKNLINKSVSNSRVSSKDRTSLSPSSKSSSPVSRSGKSRKDDSHNHSETSSNCDNSSEASNDSGKGGSVGEKEQPYVDQDRLFEFNIPSDMCGLFIGSRGKTIRSITEQSGARIHVKENPYTRNFQICVIEGTEAVIDRACAIIKRKFPTISMPGIDLNTPNNTVIMPEIMQLNLPEGVSIDVVLSSIVDTGRVFLQQPTHPTFPSLERLNSFMNQCYHHETVPDIPKSGIESGVICAAPMLNGWYRAQIMVYHEETDECDIKYVDYGGYSRIASRCLKQIRSDFMTLPFEAVECYLANITPLDNESYFSSESAVILEELTQGKMLQAQVVGKADNGLPYVHIYQISGPNQTLLINRELVNRGVVRWLELMS